MDAVALLRVLLLAASARGGGQPLRRIFATICPPLWVVLCLTPFLPTTAASAEPGPASSSQPVLTLVPSLIDKVLELRRTLFDAPQPVFPAPPGYRLPWPAGLSDAVAQAPGEWPTHQSLQAWDFDLDYEVVLAARGGRVSMVRTDERMGGCDSAFGGRANYILIDHGDGTSALYLHIDYKGALVREGILVAQGDAIAYSGSSGLSCGDGGWASSHLHFQVQRTVPGQWWSDTIPVTFDDLRGGVLVTGRSYTSGNLPPNLVKRALVRRWAHRPAQGVEVYVPPSLSSLEQRCYVSAEAPVTAAMAAPAPTPIPTTTPTLTPTWFLHPVESSIPVPSNPPPPPPPLEVPVPKKPPPAAIPTSSPVPTD
jgi:murein DD-endopeptidase MepM/ murein hydrolase activator NlpD